MVAAASLALFSALGGGETLEKTASQARFPLPTLGAPRARIAPQMAVQMEQKQAGDRESILKEDSQLFASIARLLTTINGRFIYHYSLRYPS